MIDKLSLLLDLNEYENTEKILEIAKYMTKNKSKDLLIYEKSAQILKYYKQFLEDKISIEDFLQIHDIDSIVAPFKQDMSIESLWIIRQNMNGDPKSLENKIIVVSDKALKYFISKEKDSLDELVQKLEKLGSKLFVL